MELLLVQTRIVFIAHSFERGGAQKCLYDFVRYCCGEGIECMVIGPRSGPQLQDFRNLGVEVIPVRIASIWGSGTFLDIIQYIKIFLNTVQITRLLLRFRPIAVFTNSSTIISGALASRILKLRHFWHIHENFDNITMEASFAIPRKALSKIMELTSEKVIFVSNAAMKSILPNGSSKAAVVHNGVDLSRFKFQNHSVSKDNKPCICFLGALEHRRGVDILLLALALLKHENGRAPRLDLWGSGDPEYSRLLKDLADELGLTEQVRFMGYTNSIEQVLPKYDALVAPSRGEAFPLTVLEGMAAGVPVVATKCGGPEEMIDDGISGHLVDVGDYRHMARSLEKILEDHEYAGRLAAEARSKVSRSFELSRQLEKLAQLILPSS